MEILSVFVLGFGSRSVKLYCKHRISLFFGPLQVNKGSRVNTQKLSLNTLASVTNIITK